MLSQAMTRTTPRRPRGEKKPIPDEQKDDKYFERRKRNNLAAKKSRDQVTFIQGSKEWQHLKNHQQILPPFVRKQDRYGPVSRLL